MQFWPHRRAQKETPVVKRYPHSKDNVLMGFAGYKVGMTHVQFVENSKNSPRKGEVVSVPVTIVECPPLKVIGIRTYTTKAHAKQAMTQVFVEKAPKHLDRKISLPAKAVSPDTLTADNIVEVTLIVATQPSLLGFGKKKPEIFETAIGGTVEQQLAFAKANFGKDIDVTQVFKAGEIVDTHSITKGKGFSGAMARYGLRRRQHKSEKGIRTAGSLGPWCGQGHVMYRVPSPGKHGYYKRVTYNQPIVKLGDNPTDVNASGGFIHYGFVKNPYILIKGSVNGPAKRLIRFIKPMRPNKKAKIPTGINYIHTGSHQG